MERNVDPKKPTSLKENSFDTLNSDKNIQLTRRTIVRKIAVGSAALACCSVVPAKWTTPLLEFGALPAHATTSGTPKSPPNSPYNKTERINRSGDISINKILRRKFASKKLGTAYGKSMRIEFNTGGVMNIPDTSKDVNVDKRGYRPGGPICSHHSAKEIPAMEVYAEPGSKATYITIHYKG